MGDNPNTPEQSAFINSLIQERARLEAEKKALIEEFSQSIPKEWSPDDLKEKFKDLLAKAYARISLTIDDEDNPALAFQAAKYAMGIGIGSVKISDDNDPNKEFKNLLEKLTPNTGEPPSTPSTPELQDGTDNTKTPS